MKIVNSIDKEKEYYSCYLRISKKQLEKNYLTKEMFMRNLIKYINSNTSLKIKYNYIKVYDERGRYTAYFPTLPEKKFITLRRIIEKFSKNTKRGNYIRELVYTRKF